MAGKLRIFECGSSESEPLPPSNILSFGLLQIFIFQIIDLSILLQDIQYVFIFLECGLEHESLHDSSDITKIFLDCKSVRLGSYEVKPQDTIVVTKHGVRLKVPSLLNTPISLFFSIKDIIKILINFEETGQLSSRGTATLFYFITYEASKRIREAIHMSNNNKKFYFNPASKEEQHRRITLCLENVTMKDRLFIKSIYKSRGLMEELTCNEAIAMLILSDPKAVHLVKARAATSSSNSSKDSQIIMVYPPLPYIGGICIKTEDYSRLKADKFLNDIIIDFYLKYWWLTEFTEEQKNRTYIFSSYFYSILTKIDKTERTDEKKQPKDDTKPEIPLPVRRHSDVKAWTKNVDIFDNDYIVMPINENQHWFLAVICFPELDGPVRMSDNSPVPSVSRKKGGTSVAAGGQALKAARVSTNKKSNKEDDLLYKATPCNSKVKPNLGAIKQPCILIFDSLATQSRSNVVTIIREYLQEEWKVKHKGKPKDFSKKIFKGGAPKVPQQPNLVDCGLYLLQFVEAFFKNPITDYRLPIRSIKEWFTHEIIASKRYNIMILIHNLMKDQNIDPSKLSLPNLDLSPSGEFEDDDDEEENDEDEDGAINLSDNTVKEEEEGMDLSDNAVMEEEEGMELSDNAVDEDVDKQVLPMVDHTPQIKYNSAPPPLRAMEVKQGVEVNRAEVSSLGKVSSGQRFDSPMPKVQSSSDPPPPLRLRVPKSVTIFEANSKRKLPLSLKNINTHLSSSNTTVENDDKKSRMD